MGARRMPSCGWTLLFFLGFLGSSSSGSGVKAADDDALPPTPRLFSAEVRTLRRIAANVGGISQWNFSANPCGYGGLWCDCSFNNNTICHATEINLKDQNFTGQLPPDFADLPNLLQLDLSRNLFHGAVPDRWARMRLQGLLYLMEITFFAPHGQRKFQIFFFRESFHILRELAGKSL